MSGPAAIMQFSVLPFYLPLRADVPVDTHKGRTISHHHGSEKTVFRVRHVQDITCLKPDTVIGVNPVKCISEHDTLFDVHYISAGGTQRRVGSKTQPVARRGYSASIEKFLEEDRLLRFGIEECRTIDFTYAPCSSMLSRRNVPAIYLPLGLTQVLVDVHQSPSHRLYFTDVPSPLGRSTVRQYRTSSPT